MGEAVGRLYVGAGTNRSAEGRPSPSFRRPDWAEDQHTELADLGRVVRRSRRRPRGYCAEGTV
jgi:hypothetical protein